MPPALSVQAACEARLSLPPKVPFVSQPRNIRRAGTTGRVSAHGKRGPVSAESGKRNGRSRLSPFSTAGSTASTPRPTGNEIEIFYARNHPEFSCLPGKNQRHILRLYGPKP